MKKLLSVLFLSAAVAFAPDAQAAFPLKKANTETTQNAESIPPAAGTSELTNTLNAAAESKPLTTTAKTASSAPIPILLYIILAILALGWLAMGINDNFGDIDWLISLVLYLLFYIPGLIFTILKTSKYY